MRYTLTKRKKTFEKFIKGELMAFIVENINSGRASAWVYL